MATQREKIIVEVEDQATANLKKAESGFEGFSSKLKGLAIAGGLAIAAQKMVEFGAEAISLASDAEEAASAFATTFGPATSGASAFVEEFANMAGFARHELEQMMATTGNIVQGLGATEAESAELSERMARLAGDVASFSNAAGGAEAVMGALQSATTGEREALKTYGIVINEADVQTKAFEMTGKSAKDELTKMEKALATVELAYERAGKAVGDLERTQDGFANQTRSMQAMFTEFKTAVGAALLPLAAELLPVLRGAFEALAPVIVNIAESVGPVLAQIIGVVAQVIEDLAPLLEIVTVAFELLGTVLDVVVMPIVDVLLMALGPVADAIGWVAEKLGDGLGAFSDWVTGAESADDVARRLAEGNDELTAAYDEGGEAAVRAAVNSDLVAQRYAAQAEAAWIAEQANVDLGDAEYDTSELAAIAAREQERYEDSLSALEGQLMDAVEAQESLSNAMLEAASPAFAATQAAERLAAAEANLEAVLNDAEASSDDVARAQLDLAKATLEAQVKFDAMTPENVEASASAIAAALGISEEAARDLLGQLGAIDSETFTARVEYDIPPLNLPKPSPISVPVRYDATGAALPAFHSGGIVPDLHGGGKDVLALLQPGEIVLPRGGSTGGPGPITVTVESPVVLDGRRIARATSRHTVTDITDRIGGYR